MFWLQQASKCVQSSIRTSVTTTAMDQAITCNTPASTSLLNQCLSKISSQPANHLHLSSSNFREINSSEFAQMKHGVTVIDVRGRKEIKASGSIPGSLNIPFDKIDTALQKTPQEFKKLFGINKPKENSPILFLCQRGQRSKTAMDTARAMGFRKAMSLQGGWETYSRRTK